MTGRTTAAGDPVRARRELAVAVAGCAAAAVMALWAASRTWAVEVTVRPEPLPPVIQPRSGGSLVPAMPAFAVVALAGAGALLATRGWARRVVGIVLVGSGLAVLGAGIRAQTELAGVAATWPALAAVTGLVVAVVGVLAVHRCRRWPGLAARHDRAAQGERPRANQRQSTAEASTAEASTAGERAAPAGRAATALWDAIDRGEDPTGR